MSTAVPADAPPPTARTPRWLRPLLFAALGALLLASVAASSAQNLHCLWRPALPTHLVQPPLASAQPPWVIFGEGGFDPVMCFPRMFVHDPWKAVAAGTAFAYLYLLIPVALLCALFCARLGIEQGRALELSALPGLLCAGALMFVAGAPLTVSPSWPCFVRSTGRGLFTPGAVYFNSGLVHVNALGFGLLLLACFATARADPPVPMPAGFGWTLAAGAFGALSVGCEVNALGSVGALILYAWWSAGWRRALGFALGAVIVGGIDLGWEARQNGAGTVVYNLRVLGWLPWDKFHTPMNVPALPGGPERHWLDKLFSAAFLGQTGPLAYGMKFLLAALLGYGLSRCLPGKVQPGAKLMPESAGTTPDPAVLPTASAHRMILLLLFVALMGAPAAGASLANHGGIVGWAFMTVPLLVAVILSLAAWLEFVGNETWHVAQAVLVLLAVAVLLSAVFSCRTLCLPSSRARTMAVKTSQAC